jgi:hypothetical protein
MTLESYFEKNSIFERASKEATIEQRKVSRIINDSEYYNHYYNLNLDEFMECVDIKLNLVVFDIALDAIVGVEDIFEPCCQSGIFGCYIADNIDGKYIGMDKHPHAIEKAKKRAVFNELSQSIFIENNILEYKNEHEAIIGRYVFNGLHLDINYDVIDSLSKISESMIMIQNVESNRYSFFVSSYKQAFSRLGYSFEVLSDRRFYSAATGADVFVFEAHRKKNVAYFIPTAAKPLPQQNEAFQG